mgnify:CR=1 FL=1
MELGALEHVAPFFPGFLAVNVAMFLAGEHRNVVDSRSLKWKKPSPKRMTAWLRTKRRESTLGIFVEQKDQQDHER